MRSMHWRNFAIVGKSARHIDSREHSRHPNDLGFVSASLHALPSFPSRFPYLFIYALPQTTLCAFYQGNRFDVVGVREHVDGLHRAHFEVEFAQER